MERPTYRRLSGPPQSETHGYRIWVFSAGALAGLTGAVAGWQHGASAYGAARDVWLHSVLPAFYSLLTSGLPFCP